VLGRGGMLVLVVPHPKRTFDHRRPVTTMAHLLEDERGETGEDDQSLEIQDVAIAYVEP